MTTSRPACTTIGRILPILLVLFMPAALAEAQHSCPVFLVTLQGAVNIGNGSPSKQQQFSVQQHLVIREPGLNAHPFDFLFHLPDPNAAQVGQILLMSNSFGAHNPGMEWQSWDLGAMTPIEGGYLFELDATLNGGVTAPNSVIAPEYAQTSVINPLCNTPQTQAICGYLEDYGIQSALGALPNTALSTRQGQVAIGANGQGQVYGQLWLRSSAIDNPNITSDYQASFQGGYVGNTTCP